MSVESYKRVFFAGQVRSPGKDVAYITGAEVDEGYTIERVTEGAKDDFVITHVDWAGESIRIPVGGGEVKYGYPLVQVKGAKK